MFSWRDNLRAIAAMCASMAGFITNDALTKLASDEGLPLGEIIFVRGLMAGAIIGAAVFVLGQHRQAGQLWNRYVGIRTIGEIGGTLTYLTALFKLPIANATTILQTAPLAITAFGAIFLGRVVGWRRWTAIAIGFVGVLVVIRPGLAGFDVYSLVALATVLFVVTRDIATSRIPRTIPTTLLSASTVAATAIVGLGLMPFEAVSWPTGRELLILFGAACAILVGFSFLIIAVRTGDITITAPFRYTGVFWAVMYGALLWDELPDGITYLGMAMIIGTGIYTFIRERRSRHTAAAETNPTAGV